MKTNRNQDGLASIVIVGVLVVLLALITLGFSRIMNRAVTNSVNNQLSAAASYAAQSAVNDAMAYIKGQANPDDVSSSDCTSLLKEPGLSSLVDLSGDGNTKITCLMVNPKPTDLLYQQLPPSKSQIIKATASDAVDKMMFSWSSSDGTKNSFPSSLSFSDIPTWSSNNYAPVLRVGLYPVPPSGQISGIQANSKTFFLVPGTGGGNVTTIAYSTADGSAMQVGCNAKTVTGFDSDATTSGYSCSAIISGLYSNIAPDSYYYLTLTPMYDQANVRVKADNTSQQAVQFEQVQTVIDATATANNAAKRLQERVDSNTSGDNISASADAAPDFAIRSAVALCKQIEFHQSYYDYVLNDSPGLCQTGKGGIPTVPPTLAFSIIGKDGADNGKRVCSSADTVEKNLWGCSSAANPDSPQSPVQNATVYVNNAATLSWVSTDSATYCNAGGGWSGDQNPDKSVTTWNGVTGTGSKDVAANGNITTFSLQCKGPGGTTATKSVTAWPPPVITQFSGPSSNPAGNSYDITWNSKNDVNCNMSGDWTASNIGTSGTHHVDTQWNDHNAKHFTLTCFDPIGRQTSQALNGGNGVSQSAPQCYASASFSGGNVNNSYITWNTSCPNADPANAGYPDRYITSNIDGIGNTLASTWWLGSGNLAITRPDTYNFKIVVWIQGWGDQNNPLASASAGPFTVAPPPVYVNVYPAYYYGISTAKCNDAGVHKWMACMKWNSSQSGGSIDYCFLKNAQGSVIYGGAPANGGGSQYHFGWDSTSSASVNGVTITCHSATYGNEGSGYWSWPL